MEEDNPDYRESMKLAFDFFKHLTTLSTGSVLLLVTFLDKLFQTPKCGSLVVWTVALFTFSTLGSIVGMYLSADILQKGGAHSDIKQWIANKFSYLVIIVFFAALAILSIFFAKNYAV